MAKSLVRNRHAVNKLFQLKSQLQAVSLRIAVRDREGGRGVGGLVRVCAGVHCQQCVGPTGGWRLLTAALAAARALGCGTRGLPRSLAAACSARMDRSEP
jgi:hypothetical protein